MLLVAVVVVLSLALVALLARYCPPGDDQWCTSWWWCRCGEELTNVPVLYDDDRGCAYNCPKCGAFSLWDMGAPTPLLMEFRPQGKEG